MPRSGLQAALFHPATGYSLPSALRLADELAGLDEWSATRVYDLTRNASERLWKRTGFYRALNRMLFLAADPRERRQVLERFYKLSPGTDRTLLCGGKYAPRQAAHPVRQTTGEDDSSVPGRFRLSFRIGRGIRNGYHDLRHRRPHRPAPGPAEPCNRHRQRFRWPGTRYSPAGIGNTHADPGGARQTGRSRLRLRTGRFSFRRRPHGSHRAVRHRGPVHRQRQNAQRLSRVRSAVAVLSALVAGRHAIRLRGRRGKGWRQKSRR